MTDILKILNSITNLEISNENIDSKTSAEKIKFLGKLKKEMEKSGILSEHTSTPAHALIKGVYGLLFQRQDTFNESYYETLADALANAKSYAIYIKPYEQHLSAKLDELRGAARDISRTEQQRRMSAAMSGGTGLLRKAMIALLISIGVIYSITTEPSKTSRHSDGTEQTQLHEGKYTFYMAQYVPKPGVNIDPKIFGKLVSTKEGIISLWKGGKEKGTIEFYVYNSDRPNVIIFRRSDGSIFSIGLDHNSGNYDELLGKIKDITTPFDLTIIPMPIST